MDLRPALPFPFRRFAALSIVSVCFCAAPLFVEAGSSSGLMQISDDGKLLACTNRDNGSVSVVDLKTNTVVREIPVGRKPEGLTFLGKSHTLAVAVYDEDKIVFLDADSGKKKGTTEVFDEPYGIVSNKAGDRVFVTLDYPGQLVEINAKTYKTLRSFDAGKFPRGLAISTDDKRLFITEYYTANVLAFDAATGKQNDIWKGASTDNLARQIVLHPTRPKAYLPHIRSKVSAAHGEGSIFPYVTVIDTNKSDDRRRKRIPMDAFIGNRVTANPWEIAVSPDGKSLFVVFSGTDDMFACEVLDDNYREIRYRGSLRLGKNPRAVKVAPDGKTFYVYNALDFNVVAYDVRTLRFRGAIQVCKNPLGEEMLLGKQLFYSALQPVVGRRWISCSSCHPDGQPDGRTWKNPEGLRNTQSLRGMAWTHPIHWSADRDEVQDFEHTIRGQLMQGRGLIRGRVNDSLGRPNKGLSRTLDALSAYTNSHKFSSLSPYAKNGLSEKAKRGRKLFFSKKTNCASCHSGPFFADSQPADSSDKIIRHDVGTGKDDPGEKMGPKYDTPTLLGIYRTAPYLHHGVAKTLHEALAPEEKLDQEIPVFIANVADEPFYREIGQEVFKDDEAITAHSIAMGTTVGMFIGMTPTVGIQMIIVMCVAILTKRFFEFNRVAALITVYISNPVTMIPIYYFDYRVGALFFGGDVSQDRFASILEYEDFAGWWTTITELFIGIGAFPPPGSLELTDGISLTVGGCAANVAADLAQLGRNAAIVGRVGNDVFGSAVREMMRSAGVACEYLSESTAVQTAATMIVNVAGEDRRFIHTLGANAEFTGREVTAELLEKTRVLSLGGYGLVESMSADTIATLFQNAQAAGVTTLLDVVLSGPMDLETRLAPILPHTDYFLPNNDEAKLITGLDDPVAQAERFHAAGAGTVIITTGERGTVLVSGTHRLKSTAHAVDVVDNTGSGDAFLAGLIHGLLNSVDVETLLKYGSALGALCVGSTGATTGVPSAAELDRFGCPRRGCFLTIERRAAEIRSLPRDRMPDFIYSKYDGSEEFTPQSADTLFDEISQYMMDYGEQILQNLEDWEDEHPDLVEMLIKRGLVEKDREGKFFVTPKGIRRVENKALEELFNITRKDKLGKHETEFRGSGQTLHEESKPYEFGDPVANLNMHETLKNALFRERSGTETSSSPPARPGTIHITEDDFVVHDTEYQTSCATVVLLDMSGSMMRYGKFGQAKKVAMALQSLVRGRYQGDFLQVVGFYTYATPLSERDLLYSAPKPVSIYDPRVRLRISLDNPPAFVPEHFTNIQAGLQFARRVLKQQPAQNKQIITITDGEPTAHIEGREIVLIYPPAEKTAQVTLSEVKRCANEGIHMSSFALIEDYFYLGLVNFVEQMAQVSGGIAAYCNADDMGNMVIDSFVGGRRKKRAM
eukprot:g8406.t1